MSVNIIIRGYDRESGKIFEERTKEALGLIEKHDPVNFRRVKRYLREIRQFDHTYGVDLERGIFIVGTPTWYPDVEWYASCIVHESIHLMLQHQFGFDWNLPENQERHESISLRSQARSLERINENHPKIEYLRRTSLKPTYHLDPLRFESW